MKISESSGVFASGGSYIKLRWKYCAAKYCLLVLRQVESLLSSECFLRNHDDSDEDRYSHVHSWEFLSSFQHSFLSLPLPAPASPSPAGGRAAGSPRAQSAVRRAGPDVDLSFLDFAASLRGQVFDLLLRLQIKHHVSQLLLQLSDRHVLTVACRKHSR